jgi:hypothetical protein
MTAASALLFDAFHRIGNGDGTADTIQPAVIAKLIAFKLVQLGATGLPQLT